MAFGVLDLVRQLAQSTEGSGVGELLGQDLAATPQGVRPPVPCGLLGADLENRGHRALGIDVVECLRAQQLYLEAGVVERLLHELVAPLGDALEELPQRLQSHTVPTVVAGAEQELVQTRILHSLEDDEDQRAKAGLGVTAEEPDPLVQLVHDDVGIDAVLAQGSAHHVDAESGVGFVDGAGVEDVAHGDKVALAVRLSQLVVSEGPAPDPCHGPLLFSRKGLDVISTTRLSLITALVLLLTGALAAPQWVRADAASEARAQEIAADVLEAMGGAEAWQGTRFVRWRFMGRRLHYWDRHTGDVRIESGGNVVLMNVHDLEGRIFVDGEEVTDPEEKEDALELGHAWWVNDSYWVFMPYKLRDDGVHLDYLGEGTMEDGRPAHVLELTFDGVGLTPQNRYEVLVDVETDLVGQWSYFENADQSSPDLTGPWTDWKRVGDILLAGSHGRGHDWELAVYEDLPRSVFEDPAPVSLD